MSDKETSHDWQPRCHMTIMGKNVVVHACAKCSIVKEFTSQEFWAECWGVPSRADKPAQGALESIPDHKPDGSGLDDGPYLPGREPRKRPAAKSADESAATRRKAWETRRHLYGQKGHR